MCNGNLTRIPTFVVLYYSLDVFACRHSTHARMVVSGGNAVHVVGTFKHLGSDADFKVNKPSQHLALDWCLIAVNDFTGYNLFNGRFKGFGNVVR